MSASLPYDAAWRPMQQCPSDRRTRCELAALRAVDRPIASETPPRSSLRLTFLAYHCRHRRAQLSLRLGILRCAHAHKHSGLQIPPSWLSPEPSAERKTIRTMKATRAIIATVISTACDPRNGSGELGAGSGEGSDTSTTSWGRNSTVAPLASSSCLAPSAVS